MKMEPWAQLVARIQREADGISNGLLAFDGDGTLWSGDVGDDLFMALLDQHGVHPAADEPLALLARHHGIEGGGRHALARKLFDAYQRGQVAELTICEMLTWIYAGWRVEELRAFAKEVVVARGLSERVHPEIRRVLDWAKGASIPCYVVSASPQVAVEAAAVEVGIDSHQWVVASRPLEEGGTVGAAMASPLPYGPNKVRCLRERTAGPVLAAFGDNAFDFDLLASSRVPVAVRPKPRLSKLASSLPSLVQLKPETC